MLIPFPVRLLPLKIGITWLPRHRQTLHPRCSLSRSPRQRSVVPQKPRLSRTENPQHRESLGVNDQRFPFSWFTKRFPHFRHVHLVLSPWGKPCAFVLNRSQSSLCIFRLVGYPLGLVFHALSRPVFTFLNFFRKRDPIHSVQSWHLFQFLFLFLILAFSFFSFHWIERWVWSVGLCLRVGLCFAIGLAQSLLFHNSCLSFVPHMQLA